MKPVRKSRCLCQYVHHLYCTEHTIARGILIIEYNMAGLLAAKGIPLLAHALEYVSVAYGGFFYIYAKFLHAQFKAKIGKIAIK